MSKGYGETMALLEFMSKLMNKPEPEKKPKRRKYRIREDFDMRYDATTLIHKEIEKAENLIKFLKDYEKANKKEDKKDDKKDDKGWSANQISTLLVATFPLAVLMSAAAIHVLFK